MTVKVTTTMVRNHDLVVKEFPNGQSVDVSEGHLYVNHRMDGTVAIFAPDKWIDAAVNPPE